MSNISLISVLISHPNSIIVIDDAEQLKCDIWKTLHCPASDLVKILDGLTSDCLNIQIICVYNTDISKVSNVLMRKGRPLAKYEFKELETDKANALSRKLGYNSDSNEPMSLAAIYNQEETDFQNNGRQQVIGFKA